MHFALDSGNQDQVGLPLWSTSNFNDKYVQRSLSVGTGAFSKVYLGSNIAKSAKVAIKVIDRSTLFDEEEKRLVAEIEILRELSHANIISESIQYDLLVNCSHFHLPMRIQPQQSPLIHVILLLFPDPNSLNSHPRCLLRGRELSHYPGVHEWWRSAWHYRKGEFS